MNPVRPSNKSLRTRRLAHDAGRLGYVLAVSVFLSLASYRTASAEDIYEAPTTFIAHAFPGSSPQVAVISLSGDRAEMAKLIMGHPYGTSRVRYWRSGDRTAWILEEIGKTKPITTGIIVDHGKIDTVKVLIYRESHGWEVRRPAFTKQYKGANLRDDRRKQLSKRINGISGATLSVNALTKLSRLALYLHGQVGAS